MGIKSISGVDSVETDSSPSYLLHPTLISPEHESQVAPNRNRQLVPLELPGPEIGVPPPKRVPRPDPQSEARSSRGAVRAGARSLAGFPGFKLSGARSLLLFPGWE